MKKEITIKQQRFADKYIKTDNATQSYIDAGYKATTRKVAEANARKLLAKDSVRMYIEKRMEELKKDTIASQEEVLEYFTRVMRGEEKDAFGLDAGLKDRTDAAVWLGKRHGLFTEKKEVSGNLVTEIKVTLEDDC